MAHRGVVPRLARRRRALRRADHALDPRQLSPRAPARRRAAHRPGLRHRDPRPQPLSSDVQGRSVAGDREARGFTPRAEAHRSIFGAHFCAPKSARGQTGNSGAEGNRTLDLLNAIQALSQLSYGPTRTGGKETKAALVPEGAATRQGSAPRTKAPDVVGRPGPSCGSSGAGRSPPRVMRVGLRMADRHALDGDAARAGKTGHVVHRRRTRRSDTEDGAERRIRGIRHRHVCHADRDERVGAEVVRR